MSPEAQEARRLFHNEIERQLCPADGDLSDVADIAGKCCSQTVKLALVDHLTDKPELLSQDDSEIDLSTWNRAEQWGRFFMRESVRLRRSGAEDQNLVVCRKIASWLIAKDIKTFTRSLIMQAAPRPRLKKGKCSEVLRDLVEYGAVRETQKGTYEVNPSLATLATLATATPEHEKLEIDNTPAKLAKLAKVKRETPMKSLEVVNSDCSEIF